MWDQVTVADAPGCAADVYLIPCNSDNYAYLVVDRDTQDAIAVDAAEPDAVGKLVAEKKVHLKYVLTTHHHADHSQGNAEMRKHFPTAIFLGSCMGSTPEATEQIKSGERRTMGNLTFTALSTPGHTMDHLSYFFRGAEGSVPFVFTGDFLFVAGCGYFFEGTAQDMLKSIDLLYDTCPPETYMFPGHEYTLNNLKFAKHLEAKNEKLMANARKIEGKGVPTVPSTLEQELVHNPFVRSVRCFNELSTHSDKEFSSKDELLGWVRETKNQFKA